MLQFRNFLTDLDFVSYKPVSYLKKRVSPLRNAWLSKCKGNLAPNHKAQLRNLKNAKNVRAKSRRQKCSGLLVRGCDSSFLFQKNREVAVRKYFSSKVQ